MTYNLTPQHESNGVALAEQLSNAIGERLISDYPDDCANSRKEAV